MLETKFIIIIWWFFIYFKCYFLRLWSLFFLFLFNCRRFIYQIIKQRFDFWSFRYWRINYLGFFSSHLKFFNWRFGSRFFFFNGCLQRWRSVLFFNMGCLLNKYWGILTFFFAIFNFVTTFKLCFVSIILLLISSLISFKLCLYFLSLFIIFIFSCLVHLCSHLLYLFIKLGDEKYHLLERSIRFYWLFLNRLLFNRFLFLLNFLGYLLYLLRSLYLLLGCWCLDWNCDFWAFELAILLLKVK